MQVFLFQEFFTFHSSNYCFSLLRILLLFVFTCVLIHSHSSIIIILFLSLMHFKTLQNLNLPRIAQSYHHIYSHLWWLSLLSVLFLLECSQILVCFNITSLLYFYLITLSHLSMCDSFMGVDTYFVLLLETSNFKMQAYCTFYQTSWKLAQ